MMSRGGIFSGHSVKYSSRNIRPACSDPLAGFGIWGEKGREGSGKKKRKGEGIVVFFTDSTKIACEHCQD